MLALVILDFFQTILMRQMMKYVLFFWNLEEEYQIKIFYYLSALRKIYSFRLKKYLNQKLIGEE